MKKALKWCFIVVVLVAVLGVTAFYTLCPKVGADEALTFPVDSEYTGWVGKPANLDFVSLDGRKVSSDDLRGKVVLLDFWATWCGPCMQSLDHLKGIREKYSAQGLEIVAINFDEDRAALESVVKSKELPWPQYFEGRENSIGRKFGITHYPSVWLLDKAGNVRYISALTETDKKISTLLAETEVQAAEFSRNAGYFRRIQASLAPLNKIKDGVVNEGRKRGMMARARGQGADASNTTSSVVSPMPANLSGLNNVLKLGGVILSAKPSAVIRKGESSRYLGVGEIMRLQTSQGEVELRCDKIESTGIVLTEVNSGEQVQLHLR